MCAGRIWRTCCYIWRLDDDLCILQRISAYLTYIRFSVICTVNLYTPLARYCWLFELLVLHLIKCNCSVCRQFLSKCVHRFFKSYLMYIISYHVQLWCKTSRGNHLRQCNIQFILQLCIQPEDGLQGRYVADDKLLIKLCLDLFFKTVLLIVLSNTTGMPCLKNLYICIYINN